MNIIILVCAVLSMNTIRNITGGLITRFLGKKWWAKLIALAAGLAVGLLYLNYAGYFIMGKEVNLFQAAIVGLAPFAANLVFKLISRVRLIDET